MFMCIILGEYFQPMDLFFLPFFIGWNPNPRYDPPNRWRCPHRESWTRRRSRRARQFAWIDPFFVLLNTGWIYKKGVSKWGEGPSNRQKRWPSPEVFFGGSPTRGQTPVNALRVLRWKLKMFSKTKLLSHGRDSQPEQLLSLYANPASINQVQE